jgi:hypothetical protein
MTRDPRVAEADGHGVMLAGCDRVVLEQLHIHHVSTDGVVIRPWSAVRPSREIALREVRLAQGGRVGELQRQVRPASRDIGIRRMLKAAADGSARRPPVRPPTVSQQRRERGPRDHLIRGPVR